jgi:hypothetical protein
MNPPLPCQLISFSLLRSLSSPAREIFMQPLMGFFFASFSFGSNLSQLANEAKIV